MSGFDVHADKAIKELRARLDQAERERDEARAALAVAEQHRDAAWSELGAGVVGEEHCGCVPCSGCVGLRAAGAACAFCGASPMPVPARIAAAEMARDVAWVRACADQRGAFDVARDIIRIALALGTTSAADTVMFAAQALKSSAASVAAAIRAVRGAS